MKVFMIDATKHAKREQSEAWVIIASDPEEAWEVARAAQTQRELPQRASGLKIQLSDVEVEEIGVSAESKPRLVYRGFVRGQTGA